jgi:nitrate reductase NapE component
MAEWITWLTFCFQLFPLLLDALRSGMEWRSLL